MVSNVLFKWIPAIATVVLLGGILWIGTQNINQEEVGGQSEQVLDWIEELDRNQPKDTQTATFALG